MKTAVFYHVCLVNDFKFLVQDQFLKLFVSGLYEKCDSVVIGAVYYRDDDFFWLKRLFIKYEKIKLVGFKNGELAEKHTMMLISQFCDHQEAFICYFHSKGLYHQSYNSSLWRMIMDYHVLFQWEQCVAKLKEGYDTAGILYCEDTFLGHWPHYSGTYWWATSSHIRTLNHRLIQRNAGSVILPHASPQEQDAFDRLGAEFWIGSRRNSKNFCFYPLKATNPYLIEHCIFEYL